MQKTITSFDGVAINYDIEKISDNFLILLHGAGGDLTAWQNARQVLHEKGLSTLAIDLRGHGLSGRPNSSSDYDLEKFAKDIFQVIKIEKIQKPIIVGHCLGGVVAITFHKLYPNIPKGYILISTTHKAPMYLKILEKISAIIWPAKQLLTRGDSGQKRFFHRNFDKFIGTSDLDLRRIISDIRHTSLKSWLLTYESLARFDGTHALESMQQPVLIIEGQEDSIFNVFVAQKINELVKKSKLNIIPNANHIIVINNPKTLGHEILQFAASLSN